LHGVQNRRRRAKVKKIKQQRALQQANALAVLN
jgi:hypothetical protein